MLSWFERGDVVTCPWSLPSEKNSDKKHRVNVTFVVKDVQETIPQEINEAFAKTSGFENLDAFRADVRKALEKRGDALSLCR